MANLVMGAMGNLVPKLYELLKEEYKLQSGVKERIRCLTQEFEAAQAALCEVAEVPWDQLDWQIKIWAREVREASYDMEDALDAFLVRVHGPDSSEQEKGFLKTLKNLTNLFKKSMARRKISGEIKDIMSHLQEVTERCRRYKVQDIMAMSAKASPIDPRLHAMYNKVQDLVGIDESSSELISMLQPLQQDGSSNPKMKIVSIVGVGGLGKTTLAKAVYDELNGDFNYGAFVPVGRNPELKKVLKDILMDLDKERRLKLSTAVLDERQLIDELRSFLKNKRYFIVIDDIWDISSWEQIKLAVGDDNNRGARILITTRKQEVAEKAEEVYKLRTLPDNSSIELFFIRIGGHHEGKLDDNKPDEVIVKFLKKCGGIPLAIITMASLLADKSREKWDELYRCIGFGSEDNTKKIVSFSYYDLPVHLRTCLLYLSAFPEDSFISKKSLVRKWVAEGFVKEEKERRLFETGEGYFNDLINRSMIEAVKSRKDDSIITGCRVHDMVLDFIRTMSQEENFFSVLYQGTALLEGSNVPRRLAYHNMTMGHGHHQGDNLNMKKVRSLFFISCGIEAFDPFCGFKLLRVLLIENNNSFTKDNLIFGNEHLRQLLHLRLLRIYSRYINRITEELGRPRFLQTLDIYGHYSIECPLPESLPEKLVFLSLPLRNLPSNDGIFSLMRLTSLEKLSLRIVFAAPQVSWRLPMGLRVLHIFLEQNTKATEMAFWECVRYLNKLERLSVTGRYHTEVTDLVLPSCLRRFDGDLCKLPSGVNALCLPNLSHLELQLQHLDEHDLKTLGMLPELRFLGLDLVALGRASSTVVVSEKDAAVVVYFPKLLCCEMVDAMVWFHANEEDKSISFQMWGGRSGKYGISLFRPIISGSTGGSGGAAAGGGAPRHCFMPRLQVFRFRLHNYARWDNHSCDNLGLEYILPSLREMDVHNYEDDDKISSALRSQVEAHPNRPAFRLRDW